MDEKSNSGGRKCEYLEQDRWMKEQFICDLDDEACKQK